MDLMFSWETETNFPEICVEQLLVGHYSDANKNIHHFLNKKKAKKTPSVQELVFEYIQIHTVFQLVSTGSQISARSNMYCTISHSGQNKRHILTSVNTGSKYLCS